jgi:hypothetical protein
LRGKCCCYKEVVDDDKDKKDDFETIRGRWKTEYKKMNPIEQNDAQEDANPTIQEA